MTIYYQSALFQHSIVKNACFWHKLSVEDIRVLYFAQKPNFNFDSIKDVYDLLVVEQPLGGMRPFYSS